jgi:hypothetical protein
MSKAFLLYYSQFCVPAKVIKLVGLTRPPFLSPTNLITFAGTKNGEYYISYFKTLPRIWANDS